ncbi:DSD1 family PLP-dependent enzyme [Biformimicrobium ophioploci]|uniref:DSD1 family PLP-dependent enzyme n=1 Tax=Biformimicrobium ophioploci TaxID=3036711 RepID=A0ABQ6LZ34_9GAMM|nr:DSD1 family PLP-dependent enzyme [Microbulbifer sp. NKW57]GMG87345.1 DSD1 family PLP-dependent enzyme [Microbulbifer sp. NKW57]
MKRRTLLLGGLAGAAGAGLLLRPSDRGAPHAPYFRTLSSALDSAGHSGPRLVIDRKLLRANIDTLLGHIDNRFAYRIVAKSLPSIPLLREVMQISGSNRLMLFHQPFISRVAEDLPEADVLLGKPMPVAAAAAFYQQRPNTTFNPSRQLHWLMDTPARVQQYARLAAELNEQLQVCIELDVGLHRGGVQTDTQLLKMLDEIRSASHLQFTGLMGYEPHVVKVPGNPETYRDKAMTAYSHYVELAKSHLGDDWPGDVILNCAGSPTYQLYNHGDYPFNELAAGSCLVKPSDFDIPTLADHVPASYIATPVLKSTGSVQIPGINLGPLQSLWDPNRRRTVFTYGGAWKAEPVSPAGLSVNPLYGRSTNQEMLNGSEATDLRVDDWVFLRPTQSEFVFLQFGDLAVFEDGKVQAYWPVFSQT